MRDCLFVSSDLRDRSVEVRSSVIAEGDLTIRIQVEVGIH